MIPVIMNIILFISAFVIQLRQKSVFLGRTVRRVLKINKNTSAIESTKNALIWACSARALQLTRNISFKVNKGITVGFIESNQGK